MVFDAERLRQLPIDELQTIRRVMSLVFFGEMADVQTRQEREAVRDGYAVLRNYGIYGIFSDVWETAVDLIDKRIREEK